MLKETGNQIASEASEYGDEKISRIFLIYPTPSKFKEHITDSKLQKFFKKTSIQPNFGQNCQTANV